MRCRSVVALKFPNKQPRHKVDDKEVEVVVTDGVELGCLPLKKAVDLIKHGNFKYLSGEELESTVHIKRKLFNAADKGEEHKLDWGKKGSRRNTAAATPGGKTRAQRNAPQTKATRPQRKKTATGPSVLDPSNIDGNANSKQYTNDRRDEGQKHRCTHCK